MSRSTFIVGLVISVALLVRLMRIPAGPVALPPPTMIVPVVETELAELVEPDELAMAEPSIPDLSSFDLPQRRGCNVVHVLISCGLL